MCFTEKATLVWLLSKFQRILLPPCLAALRAARLAHHIL
jgi:hypothetical protein